jgi:hypothetical protein
MRQPFLLCARHGAQRHDGAVWLELKLYPVAHWPRIEEELPVVCVWRSPSQVSHEFPTGTLDVRTLAFLRGWRL